MTTGQLSQIATVVPPDTSQSALPNWRKVTLQIGVAANHILNLWIIEFWKHHWCRIIIAMDQATGTTLAVKNPLSSEKSTLQRKNEKRNCSNRGFYLFITSI